MKSNDFAAAPQSKLKQIAIKESQEQLSLARVAAVFYAAILLVGFLDDNGHRVLTNVKGNTHTSIPPFGE